MLDRAAQKLRLDQLADSSSRRVRGSSYWTLKDSYSVLDLPAANKDELLEMVIAGAEKIINTNEFVPFFLSSFSFADSNTV